MTKVFIQQPLLPHYREQFFERLAHQSPSYKFFLTYDNCPKRGFIPSSPSADNIFYLKSSWKLIFGVVFNFSILRYIFNRFDLYIFNDNVRSPALLIFLVINFFLRRRSLLWGHGVGTTHPGLGLSLRRLFLFFSVGYITYNNHAKVLLKRIAPSKKIFVASNSLDTSSFYKLIPNPTTIHFQQRQLDFINDSKIVLVYASRLEPEKNPIKLLELIHSLHAQGIKSSLIVLGEGSLLDSVRAQVNSSQILKSSVFLLGSVTDPCDLAYIFSLSDFLVHPGVIGLTLQLSFCFSTPVVTSVNESHMPEFSMFKNYYNGLLVDFNDINDVSFQLMSIVNNPPLHSLMRSQSYDTVYSPGGVNIERFVDEFTLALKSSIDS